MSGLGGCLRSAACSQMLRRQIHRNRHRQRKQNIDHAVLLQEHGGQADQYIHDSRQRLYKVISIILRPLHSEIKEDRRIHMHARADAGRIIGALNKSCGSRTQIISRNFSRANQNPVGDQRTEQENQKKAAKERGQHSPSRLTILTNHLMKHGLCHP